MFRVITHSCLFALLVVVLASCSTKEELTAPTSNDGAQKAAKVTYAATHSQYNNDPSYVSGTVTGLSASKNYVTFGGGGLSGGAPGTVTFHDLIATTIRNVVGLSGSGDLVLPGELIYMHLSDQNVVWYYTFTSGVYTYDIRIENGVVAYGNLSTTATVIFDDVPFRIRKHGYRGQAVEYLYQFSDTPNGVSFEMNTAVE